MLHIMSNIVCYTVKPSVKHLTLSVESFDDHQRLEWQFGMFLLGSRLLDLKL